MNTGAKNHVEKAGETAGFSILEVLIGSLVLLFFMAAAYTVSYHVQEIGTRSELRAYSQQGVRLVVDDIARLIRMTGSDPSGRAFEGVAKYPVATATTLQIRMDMRHDFNDDGDNWDVLDTNDDNDTRDDNENENGDGFLNDPGEDVTFAYNAVDETITSTDNVTGDVSVLARNVLPNPDGTPLFTYVTDPVSGVPKSIRLAVTVSAERNDLLTDQIVTYTGATVISPRLESIPSISSIVELSEINKKKKKKKKKKK